MASERYMDGLHYLGVTWSSDRLARNTGSKGVPLDERKKKQMCLICDQSFFEKSSLKIHMESVHDQIKSYKCLRVLLAK